MDDLRRKVSDDQYKDRLKIGSISAASNVTGIKTPVYEAARILHEHNAYACFDFAASGPYVKIDMNKDDQSYFDAVYLSPHKFLGGPGSAGLLVLNKKLYDHSAAPTVAGGGTVDYVSSEGYDFIDDVEAREMAGTPGILQIIKAALAVELKEVIGIETIEQVEEKYTKHAFDLLGKDKNIEILGPNEPDKRISIFSFNIKYKDGYLHHKFVTKLLNDLFGIQSRAGCACAGPYGHRLLNVDSSLSKRYREVVLEGFNSLKPGWIRVNFHYVMNQEEIDYIIDAIKFIGEHGYKFINLYKMDLGTGLWSYKGYQEKNETLNHFGVLKAMTFKDVNVFEADEINTDILYNEYMEEALELSSSLSSVIVEKKFDDAAHDALRWYPFTE
jgi:selenocysteine lyase/cysteine desulfurase